MDISISNMYMKTIQNSSNWDLIEDMTISIVFQRPLSMNTHHSVPSQNVYFEVIMTLDY